MSMGDYETDTQAGSVQLWKLTWTCLVHSRVKFVGFTNFYVKGNNVFTTIGGEQAIKIVLQLFIYWWSHLNRNKLSPKN